MSMRSWLGGRRSATGVVCAVALIATSAGATAAWGQGARTASSRSARTAATPKCLAANTQSWLGLGVGGGTAGSTYYPLEFTNIGHNACTLNGYPGVSAYGTNAAQLGPAASGNGQPHGTVTLAPGATAHALVRVLDWGALCSKEVTAAGLKVNPPGTTGGEPIPFQFGACAHRRVLIVGPVRRGVGIPGYTTS